MGSLDPKPGQEFSMSSLTLRKLAGGLTLILILTDQSVLTISPALGRLVSRYYQWKRPGWSRAGHAAA